MTTKRNRVGWVHSALVLLAKEFSKKLYILRDVKQNRFPNFPLACGFFARSGNVNDSTLYNFGTNGNYWSSTVNSDSNAYNLNYNSGELYPANRNNRNNGRSVRCIAR